MLPMNVPIMVFDGVAKLPPEANGAVVVGGSNGAIQAAYISAKAGVRAAIHHDCGIGRDEAGISGLLWAEQHGMAMAAVATNSARVGDGADMLQRGIISRVNRLAAKCGVENGQTVVQAVVLLKSAPWPHAAAEAPVERRTFIHGVLCIDSVSFGKSEDAGLVVATGSHGGATAAPMTVCDPVEAPTYPINGVSVSNFVTPAWFDPMSDHATAQYDKLGKLHAPFGILKGGYVVYESAGAEHQQFGDEFPEWRKQMKSGKLARTRRRLEQAEALLAQTTA